MYTHTHTHTHTYNYTYYTEACPRKIRARVRHGAYAYRGKGGLVDIIYPIS